MDILKSCTAMAAEQTEMDVGEKRVFAQFKNEDGALVGTPFDLPLDVTRESLALLCNAVLKNVRRAYLYTFFMHKFIYVMYAGSL